MTLKYQTSKARASQQFVAEFSPHLTTIFNTSIAKGEVPTDWRQADVIPIFKLEAPMSLYSSPGYNNISQ